MSEGIVLPPVPRGTLLSEPARAARLSEALPQIRAVVAGETDAVALQASLACMLWETFVQANWCGFYRRVAEAELAVGPYQGTLGCLRISFERGVCGAAARANAVQLVPDVLAFPGHIACDARSRSELVVPVTSRDGRVRAVLDLDSTHVAGFARGEADVLAALVREVFADRADVVW
jgi:L-methionine (R)-S-oxide reductase